MPTRPACTRAATRARDRRAVSLAKGVVHLSGFVRSQADIDKAVQVARGVAGVKSVKNDMRLK